MWKNYYAETNALFFIVDASCPQRFPEATSALGILN
jgi:hypothetical protein